MMRTLARFWGFAVPHWKMLALALAAMLLYSVVWGSLLPVGKLTLEGMMAQERHAAESGRVGVPAREGPPEKERRAEPSAASKAMKGSIPVLDELEARVKHWFRNLYPVRKIIEFLEPGPGALNRVAILILTVIAPLVLVAYFFQTYAQGRVAWSIMADLRIALFEKLSGLSLGFFGRQHAGDLISRLTNDVATTRGAVKALFGDMLLHPMKLLVLGMIALFYCWELSLLGILCAPLLILILRKYGTRVRKYSRKSLEKLADVTDAVSQMFSGIRVVKAFGMEEEENAEFRQRNREQLKRAFKLVKNRAWGDALPVFLVAIGFVPVLVLANSLIGMGRITVLELVVFASAGAGMINPIKRLVRCYNILQESMGAAERIFDLLDVQPEIEDAPDAVEIHGVKEGIRFRDVTFAYDGEPVLKGVNLYVPRGQACAVVGEMGAGKSTLLDLLPRFYDPQAGSVEIDGIDVRKIKRRSLLDNIAIVSQHPFLFNRSIAENIRYGRRDATHDEVMAAAQAAHVHEFVSSLPDGYQTSTGEAGERLSGGQRQCVTIARAILKDAPILILDEATSNLDSESERAVQSALRNLMRGRTTFIIAHRLSTVRGADRIVVLKDGRIVEEGTHEDLIELGGEYEKLYRIQFATPGRPQEQDE